MTRAALLPALLLTLHPGLAGATGAAQFDYMLNCQGCHLPDGAGFPARQVPRVAGELGKFLQVAGGREFLIQVPGSAQSDLDDAALAAVINWMLETFSPDQLPADFAPYTAAEVARLRVNPLLEVSPVRAALIARLAERGLVDGGGR